MKKLVLFELKKFFFKKSILIVTILLIIVNFINIYETYKKDVILSSPIWISTYNELYKDFSGTITVEKIHNLIDIYQPLEMKVVDLTASTRIDDENTITGNVYSDYYLLSWLYVTPMEYMYNYRSYASEIVNKASENVEFYSNHSNNYMVKENQKIMSIFEGRYISDFEYTEMINGYVYYDFSEYLILIMLVFISANIFSYEQECEMDKILLTSKNGGVKVVTAKIIAIICFIVVYTVLFSIVDIIGFAMSYNTLEGLTLPVYAVKGFSKSYFNGTIISYSVVSCLMKILGFICISMFLLIVSRSLKLPLIVFILNAILSLTMMISHEYFVDLSTKIFNPYQLISNHTLLGRCEFINIFQTPIELTIFSCAVTVFITVTLFFHIRSKL